MDVRIYGVVLLIAIDVLEETRREMNMTGIRLDTRCHLAQAGLKNLSQS
jgi:hypothetical protein